MYKQEYFLNLDGSINQELCAATDAARKVKTAMAAVLAFFIELVFGLVEEKRRGQDGCHPYCNFVIIGRDGRPEIEIGADYYRPEQASFAEATYFDPENTRVKWEHLLKMRAVTLAEKGDCGQLATNKAPGAEISAAIDTAQKKFGTVVEFRDDLVYLNPPSWASQAPHDCQGGGVDGSWVRRSDAVAILDAYVASIKKGVEEQAQKNICACTNPNPVAACFDGHYHYGQLAQGEEPCADAGVTSICATCQKPVTR